MQIDFHHGVTYVVSRLAGLDHEKASLVAYCAQYVDDATNSGVIKFSNSGAMYERTSSAHKTLDYRNWDDLANHHVWIPFHFLPANAGCRDASVRGVEFKERLVCRPNSCVAQTMVRRCIDANSAPWALHRLGITMHVYADTWAHQGFVGAADEINHARDVFDASGSSDVAFHAQREAYYTPHASLSEEVRREWQKAWAVVKRTAGNTISSVLPLGHGAVLSNPDKPFLKWSYTNGRGELVRRNNPDDFLEAAVHLYRAVRRFVAGDPESDGGDIGSADKGTIDRLLRTVTDEDGHDRYAKWKDAIAAGAFSFGPQQIRYTGKGVGSWKYDALGTAEATDRGDERFPFREPFMQSNWKLFHDALQNHRLAVLSEILPHYGICAV